jgi:GST-like protein
LRIVPFIIVEIAWTTYPNLKRLLDEINARPAATRVNEVAARFTSKTEMDDDSRAFMFP